MNLKKGNLLLAIRNESPLNSRLAFKQKKKYSLQTNFLRLILVYILGL